MYVHGTKCILYKITRMSYCIRDVSIDLAIGSEIEQISENLNEKCKIVVSGHKTITAREMIPPKYACSTSFELHPR